MQRLAEYIWLDGNEEPLLRSKTRVVELSKPYTKAITAKDLPEWGFDGSSTNQATAESSDCILRPVLTTIDPFRGENDLLVFCEVLDLEGNSHETNTRAKLVDAMDAEVERLVPWFGFEQEYTLFVDKPQIPGRSLLAWPPVNDPAEQGPYYCGVGSDRIVGRAIMEKHLKYCMDMGLRICGTNAEVMPGQWEYQLGPLGARTGFPITVCDELWLSRWVLQRLAEDFGVTVSFEAKPKEGWNGAGLHTNFSTKDIRTSVTADRAIPALMKALEDNHEAHIAEYGKDIDKRLVGAFETSSVEKFSWGHSDRTASVRIPYHVKQKGFGYIEDRRPNANADPYRVAARILQTARECFVKPIRA